MLAALDAPRSRLSSSGICSARVWRLNVMSSIESRFWERVDMRACEDWGGEPRMGLERTRMAQDGR